jgi:hypothetical protein
MVVVTRLISLGQRLKAWPHAVGPRLDDSSPLISGLDRRSDCNSQAEDVTKVGINAAIPSAAVSNAK